MKNSHWKERVVERGKDVPDDVFDEIIRELKTALSNK
jgi:methyl coenzyme M reductase subunit C